MGSDAPEALRKLPSWEQRLWQTSHRPSLGLVYEPGSFPWLGAE